MSDFLILSLSSHFVSLSICELLSTFTLSLSAGGWTFLVAQIGDGFGGDQRGSWRGHGDVMGHGEVTAMSCVVEMGVDSDGFCYVSGFLL